MVTLAFMRLRKLVEEGAGSSLNERQMLWKPAAEIAGSKRKSPPSVGGQGTAPTLGRIGLGGGGGAPFKVRMLERETPPGVHNFEWRGNVCRRENYAFSHHLDVSTAPLVAVQ